MARYRGATMLDNCEATRIRPTDIGVEIETKQAISHAANSSSQPVHDRSPARQRKYESVSHRNPGTNHILRHAKPAGLCHWEIPIFISHADESIYGFPIYGEVATKVGIDASGPAVTTDTRTYEPDAEREHRQEAWLKENIPGFSPKALHQNLSLHNAQRPPLRDRHTPPNIPKSSVCVGAGHAYKFAGILGKILSELAIDGYTNYPIEPFSLQRDAITDPNFNPVFRM